MVLMSKQSGNTVPKQCIAAKAIIKNKEGKILVLRQSYEKTVDGAGQYHPPGGIVEPGETLHETIKREVMEETNLQIEIRKLLSVEEWHVNIRGDDCYFVGVFFECGLKGGNFNTDNIETSGFAWIGPDDIDKYEILQPSKKVIAEVLAGHLNQG